MLKQLLKIQFLSLLSGPKNKKQSKAKKSAKIGGIVLLYAFLALYFAFLIFSMAISTAMIFIPNGYDWLYFTIFNIVAFMMILMFSTTETKGLLFDCRDNELLLSMPIQTKDIVLSRSLTILILNYIQTLIFAVPTILAYIIVGGSAKGIVGGIFTFLLIPIPATAISGLLGYFVAYISKKFKNNNLINILLPLLFIGAYFAFVFGFMFGQMDLMEENPEAFLINTIETFEKFKFIGEISTLKAVNFIVFTLISILSGVLFVVYLSKKYVKIMTQRVNTKKLVYDSKTAKMHRQSAYSTLTKKEFSRIFTCPILVTNLIISIVFELMAPVMMIIKMGDLENALAGTGITTEFLSVPVLFAPMVLGSMMSVITACSLSLESQNFWIIKTAPISMRTLIFAKLTPGLVICGTSTLLCGILSFIALGLPLYYLPFYIIVPLLIAFILITFALYVNIKMPKFDYNSEAELIKRSGSVNVATLVPMLVSIVLLIGTMFLTAILHPLIVLAILTVLFSVILTALFYALLVNGTKKLEKMEI